VLAMVEIEEEENLSELSVTQLKKRMKERGIEASGCTEKADLIKRLESPGKHQRKGGGATSSAPTTAVEAAEAPEESPMAQLGAVGRQLVLLPVLWTSNKVDWEVPSNVIMLRVAFGVVLVIAACLLQFALLKIAAAKDHTKVKNPGDSQHLTKAEDGSCTAMEYDLAKAKETRTQLLMGGCICIGVHYKFGYMQPLLMTCIMNLFHLYDCKPLHIHLLGKKVERPWAAPAAANPLQQWAEKKKAEAAAAEAEPETKKRK